MGIGDDNTHFFQYKKVKFKIFLFINILDIVKPSNYSYK